MQLIISYKIKSFRLSHTIITMITSSSNQFPFTNSSSRCWNQLRTIENPSLQPTMSFIDDEAITVSFIVFGIVFCCTLQYLIGQKMMHEHSLSLLCRQTSAPGCRRLFSGRRQIPTGSATGTWQDCLLFCWEKRRGIRIKRGRGGPWIISKFHCWKKAYKKEL